MLLLHICCAPCGAGCVEKLLSEGENVVLYFSNSNLSTRTEFDLRLAAVRSLSELFHIPLEVDEYRHDLWLAHVAGLEAEPEHGLRCPRCFDYSLSRAAAFAGNLGCEFATTLTISPCKSSKLIISIGEKYSGFRPIDFKKGGTYQRSCEIVRANGWYRQRFCGCEFSLAASLAASRKN